MCSSGASRDHRNSLGACARWHSDAPPRPVGRRTGRWSRASAPALAHAAQRGHPLECDLLDGLGSDKVESALARCNDRILPAAIQERLLGMEYYSYGVNRVVVVLDDGTEVSGVHVLWRTEVGRVEGHTNVPFDVARVVDVHLDLRPEPEPDEGARF